MRTGPGRHADVPPDPPDLAAAAEKVMAYCERVADGLARLEAIMDAAERGKPLPDGMDSHHLSLFNADWRQIGSGLHAHVQVMEAAAFRSSGDAVALALARAEGRQEGAQASRHSHRKPRSRRPSEGQLTLIPGGRAVTTAIAAASLAAGAAGVTLGPGAVSDLARWTPASAHHAAASLPSLGPESAVLVPSSPSVPYVPRHAKPSADAASASPAPSPSVTLPPSSSAPPSPSPSPSLVNFSGQLDVQTDHLVIGPLQGAQLTFSAVGGEASWSVSAPAGLVLSARSGILGDGQPQVIKVSVPAGTPAGSGVITVTDGQGRSFQVPVTWAAVPLV